MISLAEIFLSTLSGAAAISVEILDGIFKSHRKEHS